MTTEIEQLESKISRLKQELASAEEDLVRVMSDSRPPESIYGIETMEDVRQHLQRGCWLANYRPGYIAVFEPCGGGSYGGIYGALADELGATHDRWNFDIYQQRAKGSAE